MTPIDTDESNPALQQSQRWKHRAVFRAGSLPPLHALSQPSRRLHKPCLVAPTEQGSPATTQPETFQVPVWQGGVAAKAQKTPTAERAQETPAAARAQKAPTAVAAAGAESRQWPLWL